MAGAVGALAGCTDSGDTTCKKCEKLESVMDKMRGTEYTRDKAAHLELLLRPERHDLTEDCVFYSVRENIETFEKLNYTIDSEFNAGVLNLSVEIHPPLPLEELDITVKPKIA